MTTPPSQLEQQKTPKGSPWEKQETANPRLEIASLRQTVIGNVDGNLEGQKAKTAERVKLKDQEIREKIAQKEGTLQERVALAKEIQDKEQLLSLFDINGEPEIQELVLEELSIRYTAFLTTILANRTTVISVEDLRTGKIKAKDILGAQTIAKTEQEKQVLEYVAQLQKLNPLLIVLPDTKTNFNTWNTKYQTALDLLPQINQSIENAKVQNPSGQAQKQTQEDSRGIFERGYDWTKTQLRNTADFLGTKEGKIAVMGTIGAVAGTYIAYRLISSLFKVSKEEKEEGKSGGFLSWVKKALLGGLGIAAISQAISSGTEALGALFNTKEDVKKWVMETAQKLGVKATPQMMDQIADLFMNTDNKLTSIEKFAMAYKILSDANDERLTLYTKAAEDIKKTTGNDVSMTTLRVVRDQNFAELMSGDFNLHQTRNGFLSDFFGQFDSEIARKASSYFKSDDTEKELATLKQYFEAKQKNGFKVPEDRPKLTIEQALSISVGIPLPKDANNHHTLEAAAIASATEKTSDGYERPQALRSTEDEAVAFGSDLIGIGKEAAAYAKREINQPNSAINKWIDDLVAKPGVKFGHPLDTAGELYAAVEKDGANIVVVGAKVLVYYGGKFLLLSQFMPLAKAVEGVLVGLADSNKSAVVEGTKGYFEYALVGGAVYGSIGIIAGLIKGRPDLVMQSVRNAIIYPITSAGFVYRTAHTVSDSMRFTKEGMRFSSAASPIYATQKNALLNYELFHKYDAIREVKNAKLNTAQITTLPWSKDCINGKTRELAQEMKNTFLEMLNHEENLTPMGTELPQLDSAQILEFRNRVKTVPVDDLNERLKLFKTFEDYTQAKLLKINPRYIAPSNTTQMLKDFVKEVDDWEEMVTSHLKTARALKNEQLVQEAETIARQAGKNLKVKAWMIPVMRNLMEIVGLAGAVHTIYEIENADDKRLALAKVTASMLEFAGGAGAVKSLLSIGDAALNVATTVAGRGKLDLLTRHPILTMVLTIAGGIGAAYGLNEPVESLLKWWVSTLPPGSHAIGEELKDIAYKRSAFIATETAMKYGFKTVIGRTLIEGAAKKLVGTVVEETVAGQVKRFGTSRLARFVERKATGQILAKAYRYFTIDFIKVIMTKGGWKGALAGILGPADDIIPGWGQTAGLATDIVAAGFAAWTLYDLGQLGIATWNMIELNTKMKSRQAKQMRSATVDSTTKKRFEKKFEKELLPNESIDEFLGRVDEARLFDIIHDSKDTIIIDIRRDNEEGFERYTMVAGECSKLALFDHDGDTEPSCEFSYEDAALLETEMKAAATERQKTIPPVQERMDRVDEVMGIKKAA